MNISLQILIFIAVLVLLSKALGGLCGRIGLPVVFGELLAGVALGPTAINIWRFSWFSGASSVPGGSVSLAAVTTVLAGIGVVVLMFLAGLETDLEMMKSTMGPAFWSATAGVLLPLLGGAALSRAAGFTWREAAFIGTILTATSVSITAQTLMNLGRLRSKVGSTILGAAVIDDVIGLVVLSLVIAMEMRTAASGSASWLHAGLTIVRVLIFTAIALWGGPRVVRAAFRHAQHLRGPHVPVAVALGLAFLLAFLAQYAGGMASITGAYLAGLFVASTPTHKEVIGDLRSMTNSFFGPLFFGSIGLDVNGRQLLHHSGFFVLIFLVAILGKVFGCGLGTWFSGFSASDSLVVGVGMIPRGEVGLITASIGYAAGLVSAEVYSLVVVLVLATTLVTPLLLRVCPFSEECEIEIGSLAPALSDTSGQG
ncbi:MAG TPA: cation:proton antiporter [Terriglobales bacterium]|nr:cation:proton antiporter [Terriglobales bacterium]